MLSSFSDPIPNAYRWVSIMGVVGLLMIGLSCSYDSALGEVACSEDNPCDSGAQCIDGYCVLQFNDLDGGQGGDDADAPPTASDDATGDDDEIAPPIVEEICTPETDQQFCARHGVECGDFSGEDNCKSERTVPCDVFDGIGCEASKECVTAEAADSAVDANRCACPTLDGDDLDAQICAHGNIQCGAIRAEQICDEWASHGEVYCGGCPGEQECSSHIDNVCGCPCNIDGECYAEGAHAPGNECAICDPDKAPHSFSDAHDIPCDGGSRRCNLGVCECPEEDECCDDHHCSEDYWHPDHDTAYDCCSSNQSCSCHSEFLRSYSCTPGNACTFVHADHRTGTINCSDCAINEQCFDATGQCECVPNCDGKECGDDGCGGVCGHCSDDDLTCQNGTCGCDPALECCSDGDCSDPNFTCQSGHCGCDPALECCSDGDCSDPDQTCHGGYCACDPTLECCSDGDCSDPDQTCQDGTCGCDPALECCSDDQCSDPDQTCQGGTCGCDPALECCSDDQCSDPTQSCQDGTCACDPALECCSNDQCSAPNQICQGGTCACDPTLECCIDEECSDEEKCEDGSCTCNEECCDDSDCDDEKSCVDNLCEDT